MKRWAAVCALSLGLAGCVGMTVPTLDTPEKAEYHLDKNDPEVIEALGLSLKRHGCYMVSLGDVTIPVYSLNHSRGVETVVERVMEVRCDGDAAPWSLVIRD